MIRGKGALRVSKLFQGLRKGYNVSEACKSVAQFFDPHSARGSRFYARGERWSHQGQIMVPASLFLWTLQPGISAKQFGDAEKTSFDSATAL
jgi:hypothetical protein